MDTRTQLTLFTPSPDREILDAFRARLDPIQAGLIGAHVTLCREDEIAGIGREEILERVCTWPHRCLILTFGPPTRFDGHGVLLPCLDGLEEFENLRRWILQDHNARSHQAHLTLAHPRNPRSPGNTDEALVAIPRTLRIEFRDATVIEQTSGSAWRVLGEATLGS